MWDKSFFRTEVFTSVDHLCTENQAFVEFHNTHHRYSAHAGATPNQMWHNRLCPTLQLAGQVEVGVVDDLAVGVHDDQFAGADFDDRGDLTGTMSPVVAICPTSL